MQNYQPIVDLVEAILDRKDAFNHHGTRVAVLVMDFAQKAGMTMHEIEMMRVSGSLHDIGKIFVDGYVLNAARKLSLEEYAKVTPHPREGWKMLEPLGYDPIILDVVLHHHEKWDGSGYPEGLKGESISKYARMMCIVDVYDAMTHVRPYRPAMRHEYAMAEMMNLNEIWFDPDLLALFFDKVATHG